MAPEPLLTVAEVADYLKSSRDYVYTVKHRIGCVRLGRSVRFRREDVERFLLSQTESAPRAIGRIDVRKL